MIAADFMFTPSAAQPRQPPGSGYLDLRPLYRHGLALLILVLALALRLAVLPPGYGLAFLTLYPVLFANSLYRTQLQMTHKDGHAIWVDLQGSLLSGDTGESLWMISDITEIKKSQTQIERATCPAL